MQDPSGEKYLAFHLRLLGAPGPASKDKALAAAKDVGLDVSERRADLLARHVLFQPVELQHRLTAPRGVRSERSFPLTTALAMGDQSQ